eukprot:m.30932 g.30932  ORF g.30932 m.30932 type:complete len:651 (-) comp9276_c2_seq3:61-2013(-)
MEIFKAKYKKSCDAVQALPVRGVELALESGSRTLSLSGDSVVDINAIRVLCKCLAHDIHFTEISLVDLLLDDEACKAVCAMLKTNASITCIDLTYNKIRTGGAQAIAEMLRTNATLKELYLGWNTLGEFDSDLAPLCTALTLNRTLEILDLRNNQLGTAAGVRLATALEVNKTLRRINLMWNNIGAAGSRALVSAMACNSTIIEMRLDGNHVPEDCLAAIQARIEKNALDLSSQVALEKMATLLRSEAEEHKARALDETTTLRSELEALSGRERSLQAETAIRAANEESLGVQLTLEKNDNEALRETIAQLTETISRIERERDAATETARIEKQDLTQRHEAARASATAESARLTKELTLMQSSLTNLTSENRVLQEKMNALQMLLDEKQAATEKLLVERDRAHEHLVGAVRQQHVGELARVRDDSRAAAAVLEERLKGVEAARMHAENERDTLKREVAALKSTIDAAAAAASQAVTAHQDALFRLREYHGKEREEIKAQMAARLAEQDATCLTFRATAEERSTELALVKAQLAESQRISAEAATRAAQEQVALRAELAAANTKATADAVALAQQRVQAEAAAAAAVREQESLKEALSRKDVEIKQLMATIQKREATIASMAEDQRRRAAALESSLGQYLASSRPAPPED